jgi:mRNA interferase RelE/StbE
MAWKVEFSAAASRELDKLEVPHAQRVLAFLHERVTNLDDSRSIGKALLGSQFGELWRYRVGDYRLICKIEGKRLIVLVLRIGQRKDIYR